MRAVIRFAGKAKDLSTYLEEQAKRIGQRPTEKQLNEVHRGLDEATIHQRRDLIPVEFIGLGIH